MNYVIGFEAEMMNSYWPENIVKRLVSNDTSVFDESFWERIKPVRMGTFIADKDSRKRLEEVIKPIIKRSENIIKSHKNSRMPGSQGKRNR